MKRSTLQTVNIERLSYLKMVQNTQANGRVTKGTVREARNGQMVRCTRDSGKMIWLMVWEPFGTFTVTNTKENGNETKRTGKEYTATAMELAMMENGRTTSSTVLGQNLGMTARNIRVNTQRAKSMG